MSRLASVAVVLPFALAILLLVAAGLLAAQLAIPRLAARRIRTRLLAGGGEAEVVVRALPATKLLRDRGDLIRVRGRGLLIGLGGATADPAGAESPQAGLTALDGFREVDLELVDFRTGPFAVEAFVLTRAGSSSYAMATRARTTPAELAVLGVERFPAMPGTGLIGSVAGSIVGAREIPVAVDLELISDGGALRVGAGGGSIAGYPAGPLATAIAAAVARRLEIAP